MNPTAAQPCDEMGFVRAVVATANGLGAALGPTGWKPGRTHLVALRVRNSARLASIKNLPEIYLVEGTAAPGQLAVFGSEPGEKTYSPLWAETILTWKSGAQPLVLKSDTQINAVEKKGTLTERDAHVVLNCPIIKVG